MQTCLEATECTVYVKTRHMGFTCYVIATGLKPDSSIIALYWLKNCVPPTSSMIAGIAHGRKFAIFRAHFG